MILRKVTERKSAVRWGVRLSYCFENYCNIRDKMFTKCIQNIVMCVCFSVKCVFCMIFRVFLGVLRGFCGVFVGSLGWVEIMEKVRILADTRCGKVCV